LIGIRDDYIGRGVHTEMSEQGEVSPRQWTPLNFWMIFHTLEDVYNLEVRFFSHRRTFFLFGGFYFMPADLIHVEKFNSARESGHISLRGRERPRVAIPS
jgi:hypothetical protein